MNLSVTYKWQTHENKNNINYTAKAKSLNCYYPNKKTLHSEQ